MNAMEYLYKVLIASTNWAEEPPKGMDPTFYYTLTYEGDMTIYEAIKGIKEDYDLSSETKKP